VLAHQQRLADPDGRHVDVRPDVRGDAEPARMRDPVAVDQQQVGRDAQLAQRFQQDRRLAKREQPWNVRHQRRGRRRDGLEHVPVGRRAHDDRAVDVPVGADRAVEPGHRAHLSVHRALGHDLGREPGRKPSRVVRRQVEGTSLPTRRAPASPAVPPTACRSN